MPTVQSPAAGAEVRASPFAVVRPALGLHADAEGAGGEPSQPPAAEPLERPEQLADVRWDQGCQTLKDGGSAPPLPVH